MTGLLLRNELRWSWRTRRLVGLLAMWATFGFSGPLLAYLLPSLAEETGGAVPPVVPSDGIAFYLGNAVQIGLLATVLAFMGVLARERSRGTLAFLRVSPVRPRDIVVAKLTLVTILTAGGYLLGHAFAWYYSVLLLGHLPELATLGGAVCGALYFVVLAVVAAAGGAGGSQGPGVFAALGAAVAVPILGVLPVVGDRVAPFLPSELFGAVDGLPRGAVEAGDLILPTLVSVVIIAGAAALAIRTIGRKEL